MSHALRETDTPYSPGVLSLLPMFYVGWADSVLSPSEMQLIHEKIRRTDFLSEGDKDLLIQWTDPLSPPEEALFREWVLVMKAYGSTLKPHQRQSLVDLGMEMAARSTADEAPFLKSPKTRKALRDMEQALGVEGPYSLQLALRKIYSDRYIPMADSVGFSSQDVIDLLDGPRANVYRRLRKLLRDPFFAFPIDTERGQHRRRVLNQLKALAKQGLGSYAFPEKYGGLDRRGDHIAVFEALAYHDLSLTVKFGVQFGLFGGSIFLLGTEKHHRQYIEPLAKADLLGCFAMTETGHGSNVKNLQTTITYDDSSDALIVHTPFEEAGKEYIGNALDGEMAVVFGQLHVGDEAHGVHAVIVPLRNRDNCILDGIRIEDCGPKMGLNGVDNGRIYFEHVRVPRDNLLNRYGRIDANGTYISSISNPAKRFFTMLGALVVGRICVGLASVSASKKALTIAIRYALNRRQFGPDDQPSESLIIDYPTHQRRLFIPLAHAYAYHFALRQLAEAHVAAEEADVRKIETMAAGLKAKASWHATQTIQVCREACGGKGYLSENRLADVKADSDIFTTFEGDNTVLMQLVAKGLLTEFKQSFHEEGFRAVVRYLYTRVSNRLSELNPVQTRNTNVEHLIDPEFHQHAFQYREEKLLFSLSQRMRRYLQKRTDPYQAFLKCQQHMVVLAHAYVDRLVLDAFIRAVDMCEHPALKDVLARIQQLYALSVLESEKGWYLENEYLEGRKTKAIRRVIDKICQELRPHARYLVDGFGIPDALLDADILSE